MRAPINIDLDFVMKAFVGIASPMVGVITSYQEQLEWHLRVASLGVGLLVGIMSLVSMVKKMRGQVNAWWTNWAACPATKVFAS